jgi:hypothetical protein
VVLASGEATGWCADVRAGLAGRGRDDDVRDPSGNSRQSSVGGCGFAVDVAGGAGAAVPVTAGSRVPYVGVPDDDVGVVDVCARAVPPRQIAAAVATGSTLARTRPVIANRVSSANRDMCARAGL